MTTRHNFNWAKPPRTKVSTKAAEGFRYEIKCRAHSAWQPAKRVAMRELLEMVRQSAGKYKITKNGGTFHRVHYTIFVTTDADLMLMRMTDQENMVFRIYRLVETLDGLPI